MKPRISVILAVYNGADYLVEQLDSIAHQSHPIDELIIRDDGSSDQSVSIIEQWMADHPDFPARLIQDGKNLGYIRNFATLLAQANGDWIFCSDQDDRWHENKVEKMLEVADEKPQALLVASSFNFMNAKGEVYDLPLKPGFSNHNLMPFLLDHPKGINAISADRMIARNYFQGCAMMVRKDLADEYLKRNDFELPHDWGLALLAASHEGLFFLDQPLFDYRIHDENVTGLPQARKRTPLRAVRMLLNGYYRTAVVEDQQRVLETLERSFPDLYTDQRKEELDFCKKYLKTVRSKDASGFKKLSTHPARSRILSPNSWRITRVYLFLSRWIDLPNERL